MPVPARSAPAASPRSWRRPLSALALAAVLGAVALSVLPALTLAPRLPAVPLPWPLLAGLFALTELVVLRVPLRREVQAVSLTEVVTVPALLLAGPGALLVGRVVGVLAVQLLHRRTAPHKAAFNTALAAAEAAVAVHVFLLLAGPAVGGPRAWGAAAAALLCAGVLGSTALQVVVALHDDAPVPVTWLREAGLDALTGLPAALVGLVAGVCLTADPRSASVVALLAGCVLGAFRAHARLSDRHLALERLYRFGQAVTSSSEIDAVLRSVLVEARDLLQAEQAVIRFVPAVGGTRALQVRLCPDGRLRRHELADDPDPAWLQAAVVGAGRALLLRSGPRDRRATAWLADSGLREVVVVPLRGEAGVIGSLRVADRRLGGRSFAAADVDLLERVAEQASVSLRNGRLVSQLRHDALHDPLTGLPNRAQLQQALTAALEQVVSGRSEGATVMVLDLDGFKDVNDSLGHASGDRLLQEVARRLEAAVGEDGSVARLGGDEFAVVLPGTAAQAEVLAVGGRVLHALSVPVPLDGLAVTVGASIGIGLAPEHGTDLAGLLKRADTAMYEAKGSGGGLRVYSSGLGGDDPRRISLVQGLQEGVATGALDLHLQPVAALAGGRVSRVEALVRWVHPELGPVRPDEVVPLAERAGLIDPLTRLVLDRSLAACARWQAAGRTLGVAVNVSARSLLGEALVGDVAELLARHGVPARLLTLEVAERALVSDPDRAAETLRRLRALGVRVCLDDFGSGHCSLGSLTSLPLDEIKVNRSLVRRLAARPGDVAVLRSVVELGRGLRLDVVAAGVEDAATWRLLRGLGCAQAQGWHLGHPMPVEALERWLDQREQAGAEPGAHAGAPAG